MRSAVCLAGALCALLCSSPVVAADGRPIPWPPNCSVTGAMTPSGVLIAPGPMAGTSLAITIRNESNLPMPGVSVIVSFHSAVRVCADAQHQAITDTNGFCTIQLRAAGCVRNTAGASMVTANGILIRSLPNAKSPDNASHIESQADGRVSVADLVFFGDEFLGAAAAACHDYDNDDDCDVADLTYFGDAFKAELHCTLP